MQIQRSTKMAILTVKGSPLPVKEQISNCIGLKAKNTKGRRINHKELVVASPLQWLGSCKELERPVYLENIDTA